MLTIGQLSAYAGVSVRTVRFYHQRGLLPEPERDHAGYRRYDAKAVVELIRIRTLADAGVPLARVHGLLAAGPEDFAAAVADIDRRLRAEIRAKQDHRRRIAQLAAGDDLALPPEVVGYIDRLRQLDLHERFVDGERDAWIILAAQLPDQLPAVMALKHAELDDPDVVALYRDLFAAADWAPDDPRLPALADRLVALIETALEDYENRDDLDDDLADLLDSAFLDAVPAGHRLLQLIEERGWTGWTRFERRDTPHPPTR